MAFASSTLYLCCILSIIFVVAHHACRRAKPNTCIWQLLTTAGGPSIASFFSPTSQQSSRHPWCMRPHTAAVTLADTSLSTISVLPHHTQHYTENKAAVRGQCKVDLSVLTDLFYHICHVSLHTSELRTPPPPLLTTSAFRPSVGPSASVLLETLKVNV